MKKAFTVLELLVVIAIVAILLAIIFPVLFQAGDKSKVFEGCTNPKVVSSSNIGSVVEYIYECEDGRQIASVIKPQDIQEIQ